MEKCHVIDLNVSVFLPFLRVVYLAWYRVLPAEKWPRTEFLQWLA